MTITLKINSQSVDVPDGASVLDAVNSSGTYIPKLCKDPGMKAIGACRTCLVQVEGVRGFPASCSLPASEGMAVLTDTPEVNRIRSGVLELTLGMVGGELSTLSGQPVSYEQLTQATEHYGIPSARWQTRPRESVDASNPVFNIAMESCILCGRCAQACQQGHQFIGAIDFLGAGQTSRIGTFMDRPLVDSICTTCGQCLSVCPTGAIQAKELSDISGQPPADSSLTQVEADDRAPLRSVSTTCPYCGVGCGIKLQVDAQDRVVKVLDDPENQSSVGMLCVKGRFGYTFVDHPDRLATPLIKEGGEFRSATWDEALDLVADKFIEHRGGSFATLCSAKATNEDGYIQQKLARLLLQSNNIDHCTRLCHSPSVEAMLASLGSGATSNSYTDYEDASCLVVIGCDPTSNHPVAASRMRRAVVERGAKLIVINPRRIDMCDYADLWLRPYPSTDVALLNGIAQVILAEGLLDQDFVTNRTEDFEEWSQVVDSYTPERVEQTTNVPAEDIIQAARLYARPPVPPFAKGRLEGIPPGSCLIWGMGITQHTNGTANAHGLLNLALVAGQLGRPGSGVSPLRGQNNVQGCGDAGCLPNSLPGYQGLTPGSLTTFRNAWGGVPLPDSEGLVVTEMVDSMGGAGGVKAMYITGENPLISEPDLNHAQEQFEKLDFLVVQDIFMHETAQVADVVLPATSFAEKDGTFTNSERRVQRVRRAVEPRGSARADWEIVCDLARRICRKLNLALEDQFTYSHPSEIFDEMARLTPIVAGINYQRLDDGGIQWPCPTNEHPGTTYLYGDIFPRGPRAKFVPFEQGPVAAEVPNRRFPLILNTGRVLYHWHGGTLTRRVAGLMARSPELQVAISQEDATKFGIADGHFVRVSSRRGQLTGKALITERMRPGEIFIPFVKLSESAANFLTNAAYDPGSKIPEYKVCAVRVEPEDSETAPADRPRGARRRG
ncbi:MAG: formate dehydrogenase subunit alpha [SAR202 cluster bacterium Io17-Chloro-G9]|nr:MAG: formate dehydrogenase subunit alpha [SAR202 cluster bacterium Io17-Chloro-G9]